MGGLWSTIPALFSSRGGVSWTQSTYVLNGADVTDPYWTGRPLFYPDFFGFRYITHSNAGHPLEHFYPGGLLELIPKEGGDEFHGAVSAYYTGEGMTTTNITPSLREEGLTESHAFDDFKNLNGQLSGPLIPKKLRFFTSLTTLRLVRDIAEFPKDDKSTVSTGLFNLTYDLPTGSIQFFWTGQVAKHLSLGAWREVPFSSTLNEKDAAHVFQILWKTRRGADHSFRAGLSFALADIDSRFQEGESEPYSLEVFKRIPSGVAPMSSQVTRKSLSLFGQGTSLFGQMARLGHRLEYGFSIRKVTSSAIENILDDIHLHFYGEIPFEIIRYNTPLQHDESAFHFQLYGQDSIVFPNLISLTFGLHLAWSRGWIPSLNSAEEASRINWFNLSPRFGIIIPLFRKYTSIIRATAARYHYTFPLDYLAYGNPGALGGLAYEWADANQDKKFQPEEEGRLLRREGPFYAQISPDIKRPYTDEFTISIEQSLGRGFFFTVAGYYRETRNLVETVNIGVPPSAYSPQMIYDNGDDAIPGTPDDQILTVYEQHEDTLGQDFFLLANPEGNTRVTKYRGFDITLVKKFGSRLIFFLSGTATEAIGTTSPGNTEWENDDGLVGSLYDNPNTLTFARGRARFDRAYTGRIGLSVATPGGFRLACLAKYYDGTPFARKLIVTGFEQGPFYVQAFYRGQARYEFNMTIDGQVQKSFSWGKTRLRLILECYNIFNWALATEENEWSGQDFTLRKATEVQSPRVFRLGISYEF